MNAEQGLYPYTLDYKSVQVSFESHLTNKVAVKQARKLQATLVWNYDPLADGGEV